MRTEQTGQNNLQFISPVNQLTINKAYLLTIND